MIEITKQLRYSCSSRRIRYLINEIHCRLDFPSIIVNKLATKFTKLAADTPMQSILLWRASLLVHPILDGALVGQNFIGLEPQGNFLLGAFDGVTSVADVASDVLLS
jgi:hypothetical protein